MRATGVALHLIGRKFRISFKEQLATGCRHHVGFGDVVAGYCLYFEKAATSS
jgi:hypothetical protein